MFLTPFFFAVFGRQKTGWKNNGTNLDGNLWLDFFGGCDHQRRFLVVGKKTDHSNRVFFGQRYLGSESYEMCFGEDVDVMFFNEIHVCLVLHCWPWQISVRGENIFFKLLCVCFIVEPWQNVTWEKHKFLKTICDNSRLHSLASKNHLGDSNPHNSLFGREVWKESISN